MILAINTAEREHEMALLQGDELLVERRWTGSRDDVERLVPVLNEMLNEAGRDRTDIKDILVVKGPGPYTAVRMGVSFANALAEGLGAQLHEIGTFDLMVHKAATADPVLVVLFAGGLSVAVHHEGELQIGSLSSLLADFSHEDFKVVSELNETLASELHSICLEKRWQEVKGQGLKTLGELIAHSGLGIAKAVPLVEESYLRAPKITSSTNPWKQA